MQRAVRGKPNVQTNDTYTFVLNHYKTSGKYGQRTMEVTDGDVKQALGRWMRHNDSSYFLRNWKCAPLNSNGITKTLARVGQRALGTNAFAVVCLMPGVIVNCQTTT